MLIRTGRRTQGREPRKQHARPLSAYPTPPFGQLATSQFWGVAMHPSPPFEAVARCGVSRYTSGTEVGSWAWMNLWCNRCSQTKDELEFYNDKKRKTKKCVYCKACDKASRKKWGENNPDGEREQRRAHKYGLRRSELQVLLQIPVCQACGDSLQTDHALKIDHCHEQGHIRGVLCHLCNLACAGRIKEAIVRLQKCRSYLLRELERASEQEGTGSATNVAS